MSTEDDRVVWRVATGPSYPARRALDVARNALSQAIMFAPRPTDTSDLFLALEALDAFDKKLDRPKPGG